MRAWGTTGIILPRHRSAERPVTNPCGVAFRSGYVVSELRGR